MCSVSVQMAVDTTDLRECLADYFDVPALDVNVSYVSLAGIQYGYEDTGCNLTGTIPAPNSHFPEVIYVG